MAKRPPRARQSVFENDELDEPEKIGKGNVGAGCQERSLVLEIKGGGEMSVYIGIQGGWKTSGVVR